MSDDVQAVTRARELSRVQAQLSRHFDYNAPAELFPSRGRTNRSRIAYRRFTTAAAAIQFAIEVMPPASLIGAFLEVNEMRFRVQEIRALYDSDEYPLPRAETVG